MRDGWKPVPGAPIGYYVTGISFGILFKGVLLMLNSATRSFVTFIWRKDQPFRQDKKVETAHELWNVFVCLYFNPLETNDLLI